VDIRYLLLRGEPTLWPSSSEAKVAKDAKKRRLA